MRYISTRGKATPLSFDDAVMAGLASDGGLYIPEKFPSFSHQEWQGMVSLSYSELAATIMQRLGGDSILLPNWRNYYDDAYQDFTHKAILPLRQYDHNHYILELFHGNSFAFKDMALQPLGIFFNQLLKQRGTRQTIIGATSGDTGAAAMEAFKHSDNVDVFILFPNGRVSDVQRRQMTTIDQPHIHALAIDGTFDDCQDLVKALFNDHDFAQKVNLAAVNSINWGRIASQIIYYCYAALQLGAPNKRIGFCVPSGNFGNIYAGYCAYKMGLPIAKLVTASNHNNILYRFFRDNDMRLEQVKPSHSPSMDIQISSNFERLLYDLCDCDGEKTTNYIHNLRKNGDMALDSKLYRECRQLFDGTYCDDAQTLAEVKRHYDETGIVIDPHSAIGVAGGREILAQENNDDMVMVSIATAHPAKFNDAIDQALGFTPPLPQALEEMQHKQENIINMANNADKLKELILSQLN